MLTLDTAILARVVIQAQQSAAQYPRWVAAIMRAAVELESNPYIEAMDDHTLLIGSPSGNTYIGNGTCQCEAFLHARPCWHRAAARLYHRYVELEATSGEHISVQAKKAYTAANGPRRPLFADRDAETMRRQALGEERAVLEDARRIRKLAADRATALMNETFA
jgi:hypothetical protein